MLLRFGVSNYRSIKEYQELSLAASSLKDESTFLISPPGIKEKVLPAIAIYGANASGKSNLLRAFRFMIEGILNSHSKGPASGGIARHPFKLDENFSKEPTKFDCDFIFEDVRHHYGFTFNDDRVLEEWLYVFPSGRRQIWFHRNAQEKQQFYFSDKYLKGQNRTIEGLTRPNSLFISAAAQNNHEKITPIYKYFESNFEFRLHQIIGPTATFPEFLESKDIQDWILNFMSVADTGISAIQVTEEELPEGLVPFMSKFKLLVKEYIGDDEHSEIDKVVPGQKDKRKILKFGHSVNGGEAVFLDLEDESRGTLALLSMLGPMFDCLKNGRTIIVDELDTSIHSLLSKKILELFTCYKFNKRNSQIIFTTHDTNLLCSSSIRRDEVWFTEKDKQGASHVYPLTDIKIRKADNLEKGYLQGRFGAVPFIGNFETFIPSSKVAANESKISH